MPTIEELKKEALRSLSYNKAAKMADVKGFAARYVIIDNVALVLEAIQEKELDAAVINAAIDNLDAARNTLLSEEPEEPEEPEKEKSAAAVKESEKPKNTKNGKRK